ncbi:DUF6577 family protein [Pedobacter sp. JCM 36344]|uniref:DUF6577 family protein n=1 Tax=Pedobacter sp. JCM 36344 TaxID=3374280 RepID=UPI00397E3E28
MRKYFLGLNPNLSDSTIQWRIHDLINSSVLRRTGRGLYEIGAEKIYKPELSARAIKAGKFIKKNFPEVAFCVWSSDLLNEFSHHLTAYPFILVDVERDVAESIYYQLKDNFSGVFLRPSIETIDFLLSEFHMPLFIRNLVSESPLVETSKIPTASIEKLLVDAFCDLEFLHTKGSEIRSIFYNAYSKYTVNENKLLRYASRKGRKAELENYLKEGNFNNQ